MGSGLILSANARTDLESGNVDHRLHRALLDISSHLRLTISTIKTGHPLGPTSPAGVPNSHFFYRAADITAVDGVLIAGHADSGEVVALGRALRALPDDIRPDRIYGPDAWHRTLGFAPEFGFVSDPFHNDIHADHIHIGYVGDASSA